MRLLLCCLLAMLWSGANSIAQNRTSNIRPLSVGDTLPPDLILENVTNYPVSKIRMSDYQDKLLIIDFMLTSCKSCLEELPELNKLQKLHEKNVKIILVTSERTVKVSSFFSKNKIAKQNGLTIISQDSVLSKLFPYIYIPHEVWIYKGTVVGITTPEYLNDDNILKLLAGETISWPVKRDIAAYDYKQPLFILNKETIPEYGLPADQYHSAFTSYIGDLPARSKTIIDSTSRSVKEYMINMSIIEMYRRAYNLPSSFSLSRIILIVNDTNKLVFNPEKSLKSAWTRKNSYCYEGAFPFGISKIKRTEKIKSDLSFYTGFTATIEKRTMKCLALVKKGTARKILLQPVKTLKEEGELTSIISAVRRLDNQLYSQPVLDETGFPNNTYLYLSPSQFVHTQDVLRVFEEYGLALIPVERELEMLVIKDNSLQ